MAITLARAIKAFEAQLPHDASREDVLDAIQESLEWMLLSGGGKILREWEVIARNGVFTLPRDLETPVKYKFSPLAVDGSGIFHSSYYSYSSSSIQNTQGYIDWTFEVKANAVASQFFPPKCGCRILATTTNPCDVGKKIEVTGDLNGFEHAPIHFGKKTAGEVLTIYAQDDPKKKYSARTFDNITSVFKDKTNEYVMLSGIDKHKKQYFFSYYHPDEEIISYRQVSCTANMCVPNCDSKIFILGRVVPTIRYSRDQDVLPITSLTMLSYLAEKFKHQEASNFNEVAALNAQIIDIIKKERKYQRPPGRGVAINLKGSGCSYSNM